MSAVVDAGERINSVNIEGLVSCCRIGWFQCLDLLIQPTLLGC